MAIAEIKCSFGPCDRPSHCKDLCKGHYNQQNKGLELTKFSDKPRSDYQPDNISTPPICAFDGCGKRIARKLSGCGEHKRCKKCLETKPTDQFMLANSYKAHCKDCIGRQPAYRLHHLTKEQYETMLEEQQGLCANPNCFADADVIDHDHSCCPKKRSCGKCVRGILCRPCNTAEGFLKSNPNLAIGLAEYIIMSTKQLKSVI